MSIFLRLHAFFLSRALLSAINQIIANDLPTPVDLDPRLREVIERYRPDMKSGASPIVRRQFKREIRQVTNAIGREGFAPP